MIQNGLQELLLKIAEKSPKGGKGNSKCGKEKVTGNGNSKWKFQRKNKKGNNSNKWKKTWWINNSNSGKSDYVKFSSPE
jgi:hypothetical protein